MEQVIHVTSRAGVSVYENTILHGTFRPSSVSGSQQAKTRVVSCSTPHFTYVSDSNCWMHIFGFHKETHVEKFILPSANVTALAVDCEAGYVYAGTETGSAYIWDKHTGNLIRTIDAHFKQITAIRVVHDLVLTASSDAVVHVWDRSDLTNPDFEHGCAPLRSLSEHTMEVTGMWSGIAVGKEDRVVTCSLDRTCKLWDLRSGKCMLSLVYPVPIQSVLMDYAETIVLAGGMDGNIYRINLYPRDPERDFRQAVGDSVHIGSEEVQELIYRGHKTAVGCLEWSIDGTKLYSGSVDGDINTWDVSSLQLLSTMSTVGPVTQIELMPKPSYLFTKSSPLLAPPMPLQKNFQRRVNTLKIVKLFKPVFKQAPRTIHVHSMASRDDAFSKEIEALKKQVGQLKEQNAKLTQMSKDMYNTIVQKFMSDDKPGN